MSIPTQISGTQTTAQNASASLVGDLALNDSSAREADVDRLWSIRLAAAAACRTAGLVDVARTLRGEGRPLEDAEQVAAYAGGVNAALGALPFAGAGRFTPEIAGACAALARLCNEVWGLRLLGRAVVFAGVAR